MLSTMPVQLTEILSVSGETPPAGRPAPGLAPEPATFAALLRKPLTASAPWLPPGPSVDDGLPPGGKGLPLAAPAGPLPGSPPSLSDSLPDSLSDVLASGDLEALLAGHATGTNAPEAALLPQPAGQLDAANVPVVPLVAAQFRIDPRTGTASPLSPAGQAAAEGGSGLPLLEAGPLSRNAMTVTASPLAHAPAAERALPAEAAATGLLESGEPVSSGLKDGAAAPTLPAASRFETMLAAIARDGAAVPAPDPSIQAPATLPGGPAPAGATAASPAQPALPQPFQASVGVTPGDPGWADAFGEQVVVLSGKQVQRAEIRLHPAELGPIHVQVTVEDDSTRLAFTAHHAVTRDAIEQALPRLRELFSGQGLSLGDASVAGHGASPDRDTGSATRGFHSAGTDPSLIDEPAAPGQPQPVAARRSLVDVFA